MPILSCVSSPVRFWRDPVNWSTTREGRFRCASCSLRTWWEASRTVALSLSFDDVDEGGEPVVFAHLGGYASAGLTVARLTKGSEDCSPEGFGGRPFSP